MKNIYNNHLSAPKYLMMSSYALDISDQSIRYGKLVPSRNGFQIVHATEVFLSGGVVVSGKIEDDRALVKALTEIRIKEKMLFVRISLPEEQMYLFNLVLPIMPYKDIRETILLQIEEHVPLLASDIVFDFDLVRESETHITVQVSASSAILIESYLSVFEQAGLVPLSFEIEAQSIARAVIPADYKGTAMIVDFGQTRTGISIADAGRVLFTSTFSIGGRDLSEMIAKNFNVSISEAEKMKMIYSQGNSIDSEIFPIILNGISVLRDELNKHYSYWHTHEAEDGKLRPKIEKIILCGGNANLSGVAEYFEASLHLPVEHADVWVNILDIKNEIPQVAFRDSLSYATVLGLSLLDFNLE